MINPATIAAITAKQRARKSKRIGNDAELVVMHRLRACGMQLVERVTTPSKIIRRAGKIVGQSFTQKVSGDIRAIESPSGRSVLCEVKFRPDQLSLSDFRDHQRRALNEHWLAGGLSLVGWLSSSGVHLMEFHILCDHMSAGHPIDDTIAKQITWRASV